MDFAHFHQHPLPYSLPLLIIFCCEDKIARERTKHDFPQGCPWRWGGIQNGMMVERPCNWSPGFYICHMLHVKKEAGRWLHGGGHHFDFFFVSPFGTHSCPFCCSAFNLMASFLIIIKEAKTFSGPCWRMEKDLLKITNGFLKTAASSLQSWAKAEQWLDSFSE